MCVCGGGMRDEGMSKDDANKSFRIEPHTHRRAVFMHSGAGQTHEMRYTRQFGD